MQRYYIGIFPGLRDLPAFANHPVFCNFYLGRILPFFIERHLPVTLAGVLASAEISRRTARRIPPIVIIEVADQC
jgi:hypothetical protein